MRPSQTGNDTHIFIGFPRIAAEPFLPQITAQIVQCHGHVVFLAKRQFGIYLTADGRNLSLQTPHTRLTRVIIYYMRKDLFLELQLACFQTMVRQLFRDQMPFGNLLFLFLQVTGHLDQLHSVE